MAVLVIHVGADSVEKLSDGGCPEITHEIYVQYRGAIHSNYILHIEFSLQVRVYSIRRVFPLQNNGVSCYKFSLVWLPHHRHFVSIFQMHRDFIVLTIVPAI